VLLAAVVGGVFAATSYVLIETVEYELIDARLSRTMKALLAGRREGAAVVAPLDMHFVAGDALPDALRGLGAGLHEIELDDRVQHALIVDDAGQWLALIADQSDFERVEAIAFVVLALGFVAGLLLAVGIGRAMASRVIAPVTALASAVERDELTRHPELLRGTDEIGVLGRAFAAKTAELRRFLDRERMFTADVSHELRTPLTVMLGAAELLSQRLAERPELHAVAERIRRHAADTAARVAALLQLAREREATPRERLDLKPIVEREIERCRPLLDGKPVELVLDAPASVWVQASAELAAVAVDNLLRNACLFTQRGQVQVQLRGDALVVVDSGPGVPDAVRERLFQRFVHGDAAGAANGSGLGLSIAQRVAEQLGWRIRLDATGDGGSRFTLQLRDG
jgi:signal transduction histidine kinase